MEVPDCFLCICTKESFRVPSLFGVSRAVSERVLTRDSVLLLGDLNTLLNNDGETWRGGIGRNNLPDLNPSGVLLSDFCAHHVHKCSQVYMLPEHPRPKTDDQLCGCIIRSVCLDTWVKRRAELSIDHCLMVSGIRRKGSLPDRPCKPKCIVRVN